MTKCGPTMSSILLSYGNSTLEIPASRPSKDRSGNCWKRSKSTRSSWRGWKKRGSAITSNTSRKHLHDQPNETSSQCWDRIGGAVDFFVSRVDLDCTNRMVPELCQAKDNRVNGRQRWRARGSRLIPV